jgi:sugar phosphate isomerase/epimerase
MPGGIHLPFRLGTTSYIIPDDLLPNLRFLRHYVADVELVLFDEDTGSNMPSERDVSEMARLCRMTGLSLTVHMPMDTRLGSEDEEERVLSVGKCIRMFRLMSRAEPFAWILHLHGDHRGEPPSGDIRRWVAQNRRSLSELLENGPPPGRICVETLDYDFEHVAGLIEAFDLSVCLDLGHLLANGYDVEAHLDRWMKRARVFHIHGVRPDGTDHVDLGYLPDGFLEDLADRLARLPAGDVRVVTMEVFGEEDFHRSLRVIRKRLGDMGNA